MDSAVALEELSTISEATGQADQADGNGAAPDPAGALTEAGELAGTLDDNDLNELIRSYHQAEQAAPTRAHPKLSYDGALGRLTFRLAGLIDDVRDGTDSRPAGTMVSGDATQARHELETDASDDHDGRAAVAGGDRGAVESGSRQPSPDA
jgi:hypothetical protein